jgi:hypothetical protein
LKQKPIGLLTFQLSFISQIPSENVFATYTTMIYTLSDIFLISPSFSFFFFLVSVAVFTSHASWTQKLHVQLPCALPTSFLGVLKKFSYRIFFQNHLIVAYIKLRLETYMNDGNFKIFVTVIFFLTLGHLL